MAHYAKVLEGKVVDVIVAESSYFDTFVDTTPGDWIQTSYNTRGGKHYDPDSGDEDSGTPVRKNFASVGWNYDATDDAFYDNRPKDINGNVCASWTLNTTTYVWDPPIAYPSDGKLYQWDESSTSWKEQT
jgi:hypothetical protein